MMSLSKKVSAVAEHRSLKMLGAREPGMSWETGRDYLKGLVLDLSVNHRDDRRAGDRFHAIAILTAVAVHTVTEGAAVWRRML
jgi:hypothetical protein